MRNFQNDLHNAHNHRYKMRRLSLCWSSICISRITLSSFTFNKASFFISKGITNEINCCEAERRESDLRLRSTYANAVQSCQKEFGKEEKINLLPWDFFRRLSDRMLRSVLHLTKGYLRFRSFSFRLAGFFVINKEKTESFYDDDDAWLRRTME